MKTDLATEPDHHLRQSIDTKNVGMLFSEFLFGHIDCMFGWPLNVKIQ